MKNVRLLWISVALVLVAAAVCTAAEEVKPEWWGKAPGPRPFVQGVVANVSATNIAVQTRDGLKPFTVDEKTKVMVRGQKATIADVKLGDPVGVKFKLMGNNVPLALAIVVPKPMLSGEIVSIQGNLIIVRERVKPPRPKAAAAAARPAGKRGMHGAAAPGAQPAPGAEPAPGVDRRVVVNDNTKYRSHGYQGTINDLRVGYRIHVSGTINGQDLVADTIEFMPAMAEGTVTGIENGVITVKTVRQLTL